MQDFADALCNRIRLNKLDDNPLFKNKFGYKLSHGLLCLIILGLIYIVMEYTTYWLSIIFGLVVPAYFTYKCLESSLSEDDSDNEDERKFWITYWIIFGLVEIVESLLKSFLFKLPLYNIIKILFFIWLQHPSLRGAIAFYETILKTLHRKVEERSNQTLEGMRRFSRAKQNIGDVLSPVRKRYNIN